VDAALTGAMLDTVFVFLDGVGAAIGPLSKGARAAEAVVEAARQGARATVTQGLREALQGAGGRIALEKAVAEVGVAETARVAGMTTEQLAELAGKESELGRRILSVKDLAAQGGKGLEELAQKVAKLSELTEGVEETVARAFDAFGYVETIKKAGGWKALTKTLGADSAAAGPRLKAWRDGLVADMQAYIARTSKGRTSAVPTGSQKLHTSDMDVSMFGEDAAQTVAQAREYLAARAGIKNNELGRLLDADMFVDPARIHLHTVTQGLTPETVARIEKEATRFEEQLIFGRRLWEARQAGDAALEAEVRAEARALGIQKVWEGYKPMSADQIAARQRDIDLWVKELETATDEAHKEGLIQKIGRNQAEILAEGKGGYATHGGVHVNVTTRAGDFDKMPEAYRRALGERVAAGRLYTTERYTAILAEGPHLDRAVREIGAAVKGGAEHVAELADAIKDFGKHGERVANLLGADVVGPVGGELKDLAVRLRSFADQAKDGTVAQKAAAKERLAELKGQIDVALAELKTATAKGTSALRKQAELGAATDPKWMTAVQTWDRYTASVAGVGNRLSAATAATLQSLGVVTRAASAEPGAGAAGADAEPPPASGPPASFDRRAPVSVP
jgi:hypothetical protein